MKDLRPLKLRTDAKSKILLLTFHSQQENLDTKQWHAKLSTLHIQCIRVSWNTTENLTLNVSKRKPLPASFPLHNRRMTFFSCVIFRSTSVCPTKGKMRKRCRRHVSVVILIRGRQGLRCVCDGFRFLSGDRINHAVSKHSVRSWTIAFWCIYSRCLARQLSACIPTTHFLIL